MRSCSLKSYKMWVDKLKEIRLMKLMGIREVIDN